MYQFKSVSTRPFTALDTRNNRKRSRIYLWDGIAALGSLEGCRAAIREALVLAGLPEDIELCKPLRKDSVDTSHFTAMVPYPLKVKGEPVDIHIRLVKG